MSLATSRGDRQSSLRAASWLPVNDQSSPPDSRLQPIPAGAIMIGAAGNDRQPDVKAVAPTGTSGITGKGWLTSGCT